MSGTMRAAKAETFDAWNGQYQYLRYHTDSLDFCVIITHRNVGHVRLWPDSATSLSSFQFSHSSLPTVKAPKNACPSTLQTPVDSAVTPTNQHGVLTSSYLTLSGTLVSLRSNPPHLTSVPNPQDDLCSLLILISSKMECGEFKGEAGCTLPVQSSVPALFSLYHISKTSKIYMDTPSTPPFPLCSVCRESCLVWSCFPQPQSSVCLWPLKHLDPGLCSRIPWHHVFPFQVLWQQHSSPNLNIVALGKSCQYGPWEKFIKVFLFYWFNICFKVKWTFQAKLDVRFMMNICCDCTKYVPVTADSDASPLLWIYIIENCIYSWIQHQDALKQGFLTFLTSWPNIYGTKWPRAH